MCLPPLLPVVACIVAIRLPLSGFSFSVCYYSWRGGGDRVSYGQGGYRWRDWSHWSSDCFFADQRTPTPQSWWEAISNSREDITPPLPLHRIETKVSLCLGDPITGLHHAPDSPVHLPSPSYFKINFSSMAICLFTSYIPFENLHTFLISTVLSNCPSHLIDRVVWCSSNFSSEDVQVRISAGKLGTLRVLWSPPPSSHFSRMATLFSTRLA